MSFPGFELAKPHPSKYELIKRYALFFGLKHFLETGTHKGGAIEANKDVFESIKSIELTPALFIAARAKFVAERHVEIIEGDSGVVLPQLLATDQITHPTLFWLDGHWDNDATQLIGEEHTPIMKELRAIFRHPLANQHVILVDDARLFRGYEDCKSNPPCYPSLKKVIDLTRSFHPDWNFQVVDDVIRIHSNHFPIM